MIGGLPEDSMPIIEESLRLQRSRDAAVSLLVSSDSFANSDSFCKLSNATRVRLAKIGERIKL